MAGQREGSDAGRGETREGDSASAQAERRRTDDQGEEKKKPSTAEWVVGIVCAMVVLAAVGYLFDQALSGRSTPPMISVRAERVVPMRSGGYLVEIRALNEGSSTASSLHVEGALMRDTTMVEKSNATIDFVPAETERRGGLFFTKDPRRYRIEVRPTGFDRP